MIWYSVNIEYDGILITFMKSRDAKLSNNLKARVFIFTVARFAKLANFQNSRGGKMANAGVAVVDFGEHKII